MSAPALSIKGLRKKFGARKALDGLDLEVPVGSIFGLVGPNGAGKTTSFSILAGLLKSDSGEISILGDGPYNPSIHKGRLTLLPQDSMIPGHSRVIDILTFLARLQGQSKSQAIREADELLDKVDLRDRANSPIKTLSHGMVRRITVAQAFLGNPDLILLDEPTSGLDPEQVVKIRQLLLDHKKSQTIIVSSHILSEIEGACDNVAFIEKGKRVRQDTMDAITLRRCRLVYRVEPGPVPVDQIKDSIPGSDVKLSEDKQEFMVQFPPKTLEPRDINQIVTRILNDTDTGLLEIRMGSDLESEYLNSR